MIRVAVVGASKLNEDEERDAYQFCGLKFNELRVDYGIMNVTIISGGAKGIDSIAEEVAKELGLGTEIFKPEVEQWEDDKGKIGYKTRNIKIAERCDILYCLPSNLRNKNDKCYHCNMDHQVGGGCWTMKQAKKLKKQTFLIPPIKR